MPGELVLGSRHNQRVPIADQNRQRVEAATLLERLRTQPGVILADEVGMGKTFVALAVAYCVAVQSPRGPAVVMVPANLVDKWEQDLRTFCELYLEGRKPLRQESATPAELKNSSLIRYSVARHSIELLKLLDDEPKARSHLIFLAHGAMGRRQTDKWVRLAMIGEALRRHGRGAAARLIQVKEQIHRFLGELIGALGEERAHGWGDELWQTLLRTDPATWRDTYNKAVRDEKRQLNDEPVPKAVVRAIGRLDFKALADALRAMPVRARGGDDRVSERITAVRQALRNAEELLWNEILAQARWRSPLLVMDEAHHLKNPATSLARVLQSPDTQSDLRTGDGAMAKSFDRMLFLTATPFQLGHHELVRVLERFGDVRWDEKSLGSLPDLRQRMGNLGEKLDASQRAAIALQRAWSHLSAEDIEGDVESWWINVRQADSAALTYRVRAVADAFEVAKLARDVASEALRPWVLRHNKGAYWPDTTIQRRQRLDGALILGGDRRVGLPVPPAQLLPFFLAARSAVGGARDLLGDALCSSYEAFRFTRESGEAGRDETEQVPGEGTGSTGSNWYLGEFDRALKQTSPVRHPKVSATVKRVVDLWEAGEKVLVFAFYRQTCRALRLHISDEIERRIYSAAQERLRKDGQSADHNAIDRLIDTVQRRYFDDKERSKGRRAVDAALGIIVQRHAEALQRVGFTEVQTEELLEVMRRFLRVATTLVRCFPLESLARLEPATAVRRMLDHEDASGVSWRRKFDDFIEVLTDRCSTDERSAILDAASRTQTRDIRVEVADDEDLPAGPRTTTGTLANVQVATGRTRRETRSRLMRAFNTPFFPDILVCSEVMSEGVDLQRFCRHVIHHDLAWNPSTIEQRTGRIDRLGCKAESKQSIDVYLPYLAGAADERQYNVMSERERWFQVVMGQDEVARLIDPDSDAVVPLPDSVAGELKFKLGVVGRYGAE